MFEDGSSNAVPETRARALQSVGQLSSEDLREKCYFVLSASMQDGQGVPMEEGEEDEKNTEILISLEDVSFPTEDLEVRRWWWWRRRWWWWW